MKTIKYYICVLLISAFNFSEAKAFSGYDFMGCSWFIGNKYFGENGQFHNYSEGRNDPYKSITFSHEAIRTPGSEFNSYENAFEKMTLVEKFKDDNSEVAIFNRVSTSVIHDVEIENIVNIIFVDYGVSGVTFFNVEVEEFKEIVKECTDFPETK